MHAASGGSAGTCLHRRTLQCAAGRQLLCRQLSLAHRARHVARASPGSGSDDSPDKPDIDALAKMLSAEAARLRASMEAGGDEPSSSAAAARQRSAASKQQPQMQVSMACQAQRGRLHMQRAWRGKHPSQCNVTDPLYKLHACICQRVRLHEAVTPRDAVPRQLGSNHEPEHAHTASVIFSPLDSPGTILTPPSQPAAGPSFIRMGPQKC